MADSVNLAAVIIAWLAFLWRLIAQDRTSLRHDGSDDGLDKSQFISIYKCKLNYENNGYMLNYVRFCGLI